MNIFRLIIITIVGVITLGVLKSAEAKASNINSTGVQHHLHGKMSKAKANDGVLRRVLINGSKELEKVRYNNRDYWDNSKPKKTYNVEKETIEQEKVGQKKQEEKI